MKNFIALSAVILPIAFINIVFWGEYFSTDPNISLNHTILFTALPSVALLFWGGVIFFASRRQLDQESFFSRITQIAIILLGVILTFSTVFTIIVWIIRGHLVPTDYISFVAILFYVVLLTVFWRTIGFRR